MASNTSAQPLLTRAECNVLRGVAIIGIFLHNFCHWLSPIVKENEYTFVRHNVDVVNQVLSHPDIYLPVHLLSFFGHYGVPVFLFLSAYGLVKKYEAPAIPGDGSRVPGRWQVVRYHYLKLLKMMIVGLVAFVLVDAVTPGSWHYTVTQVLAQLVMVNNLLPDPDHQIWPGPYWFFGLMLQLYIVYRLVLCRRHWAVTVALMVVCVGLQLMMSPEGDAITVTVTTSWAVCCPSASVCSMPAMAMGCDRNAGRHHCGAQASSCRVCSPMPAACCSACGQWLPPSSASEPSAWSSG